MIYLEKGQELKTNPGLVVSSTSGYYDDEDSVECAMAYAPDEAVCRYEAKFIAYGDAVYQFSDKEKLMEIVKEMDPATLLGKTSEDVVLDKKIQKIKKQNPDTTNTEVDPEELASEPSGGTGGGASGGTGAEPVVPGEPIIPVESKPIILPEEVSPQELSPEELISSSKELL